MEASDVGELSLWYDSEVSSVKFNLHILKLVHSSFRTLYNLCFRMNIKWQYKHVFKTVMSTSEKGILFLLIKTKTPFYIWLKFSVLGTILIKLAPHYCSCPHRLMFMTNYWNNLSLLKDFDLFNDKNISMYWINKHISVAHGFLIIVCLPKENHSNSTA